MDWLRQPFQFYHWLRQWHFGIAGIGYANPLLALPVSRWQHQWIKLHRKHKKPDNTFFFRETFFFLGETFFLVKLFFLGELQPNSAVFFSLFLGGGIPTIFTGVIT